MRVPGTSFSISAGSFAVGAAAAFVAPVVLPIVTSALKSAAITGIKTGIVSYEKGKELVFSTKESLSGLLGIVKSKT
jgi:hypothetical protein